MKKEGNALYILHVSDFHIYEKSEKDATDALVALTETLKAMNINISYLIHTGDIINSTDIANKIKNDYGDKISDEEYDKYAEEIASKRLEIAENILKKVIKDLDILQKNIVICCGNHDKVRYRTREDGAFAPFQKFLENICQHEELTALHELNDLNILVLNTNISDDKKVTCVDCKRLKDVLNMSLQREERGNWFYTYRKNIKQSLTDDKVNIIVAHQPLYDICEHIRLPYGSETQTTDFLSALQDFINGNGIYLCGDKHTSSIAASYIHDIPHYFCGHPFTFVQNNLPDKCMYNGTTLPQKQKIDYNLIEVRDGKTGQVRKLNLFKKKDGTWECQIHPIDAVVSSLYENSKKYIVKNSFALLATQSSKKYSSWENLSWRNLFNRLDTGISTEDLKEISEFYGLFCRLKNDMGKTLEWDEKTNIFYELCKIVNDVMNNEDGLNSQNILNIRGDYSSGKSTFLGLFYIYLLYRYSFGKIDFIPAYFNLENDEILNKIQGGSTYSLAVKRTFTSFVEKIEDIAKIEQIPVCYIIDGLDEQDIWSESSQDSIGRVVLDILAETQNSKYIMSFCQNKLARFKNTMSAMKYYEKSYVMYFNSISVKEKNLENSSFVKFVEYIVDSNQKGEDKHDTSEISTESSVLYEPSECSAIRKLRRLSINTGFIYHNYQYLKDCRANDSINTVYMRYIDQQHQICLSTLGYNFVHYAPAMAYFFTYEGYTYERFKAIAPGSSNYWEQKILEFSNKIYKTFIFIKKHKDAREYLLALHYNRELRFYAENPKSEIPENSIINKLIPRNISIIIKKLWRNDQNKFIIVCRNLIEKRKLANSKAITNCTLSMLTYILAYMDKIPNYIRDEIRALLMSLEKKKEDKTSKDVDPWMISGNDSEKMKKFIDLNFLHSQKILGAINSYSSVSLVKELLSSPHFALYNRQYMMWYYGDLTIYGENKINNLVPGKDVMNQGIDYYNCFYTLYHKIYDYYECDCSYAYPLLEFDLFTICDLVYSRILHKYSTYGSAFLVLEEEKEKAVYTRTKKLLDEYIKNYKHKPKEYDKEVEEINIDYLKKTSNGTFDEIVVALDRLNIKYDDQYVYCFFKVLSKL